MRFVNRMAQAEQMATQYVSAVLVLLLPPVRLTSESLAGLLAAAALPSMKRYYIIVVAKSIIISPIKKIISRVEPA